jgi:hypothetical protein
MKCVGDCSPPNGDGCYTLSPNAPFKVGAVWGEDKVDITSSFEVDVDIFLGIKDITGADGMAFVIQNIGNEALGLAGGNLGFKGLTEHFAVAVDTCSMRRTPSTFVPGFLATSERRSLFRTSRTVLTISFTYRGMQSAVS